MYFASKAYEYLLKGWIQTGKSEDWLYDMYKKSINGAHQHQHQHHVTRTSTSTSTSKCDTARECAPDTVRECAPFPLLVFQGSARPPLLVFQGVSFVFMGAGMHEFLLKKTCSNPSLTYIADFKNGRCAYAHAHARARVPEAAQGPPALPYHASLSSCLCCGTRFEHKMDHLVCFMPGLLALGVAHRPDAPTAARDLQTARDVRPPASRSLPRCERERGAPQTSPGTSASTSTSTSARFVVRTTMRGCAGAVDVRQAVHDAGHRHRGPSLYPA